MRVTNRMMMSRALHDIGYLKQQYRKAQDTVNGRVLERPSDDPQRVVEAMDLSGVKLRIEQSKRAGEDAIDWLRVAETATNDVLDNLQVARELVLQAGNPGALDPSAREAMAAQIIGIRDTILATLNTQHRDYYVFAGSRTDVKPYEDLGDTVEYRGFNMPLYRDVAPGLAIPVNLTEDRLDAVGLLGTLTQVAEDLRSGDDGVRFTDYLARLDASMDTFSVARSDLGARYARVEQYLTYSTDQLLDVEERLTTIAGVDLETAVLNMTQAQTAYQAALAAFAKTLPNSLIDYMLR